MGQVEINHVTDPFEGLAAVRTLRERWAEEQGRPREPGDPFDDDLHNWFMRERDHREFWIAYVDSKPVGMINLFVFDRMPTVGKPGGGWGYLCNMYVDEEHRSSGIGALLADALLRHADDNGLERVVLSPSERSRPFYARLGFDPAVNLLLRPRT